MCWKDKSGKVIGCGDKVPPEYQDSSSSTLNKQGVTVKQRDAAQTPEQQHSQGADTDRKKADAAKANEQARRDRALLDSFSNEKEIELKRVRDVQQIENNLAIQDNNIKSMMAKQAEMRGRMDQMKKENKAAPAALQQEYDKLSEDIAKNQEQAQQKRKDIVAKNAEFDAMKKRFAELMAGTAAPAAAPAPASVPAKK